MEFHINLGQTCFPCTTYGAITADNLAFNLENLHCEWSSTEPLEALWTNIIRCRQIAHNLNPISDMQAAQAALKNLDCTGVFVDAVNIFCLRPLAERTFNNIWEHFNLANRKRMRALTAKSAGYHGAELASANETKVPTTNTGAALAAMTSNTASTLNGLMVLVSTTWGTTVPTLRALPPGTTPKLHMLGGNNTHHRQKGKQPIYKPRGRAAAAVVPPSDPPAPVDAAPITT